MRNVLIIKPEPKHPGGLEKSAERIIGAFKVNGDQVTTLVKPSENHVIDWMRKDQTSIVLGLDRFRFQTHIRAGNGCHQAFLNSRRFSEGALKYYSCRVNPKHIHTLKLEKASFECSDLKRIIAISQMVKNDILDHYDVDPNKITVVHNGVEWHEMEPAFKASFEIKRSEIFTFLFIGNGYKRKGLSLILQALVGIKNVRLLVVGKDNQEMKYQALATKLKIDVEFFGPQKDVIPFYQQADALVIPAFYEPFGNVTVEALAMGLKVVASKTTGSCEVLTKETGVIIENLSSIDSIREALVETMKLPKELATALPIRKSIQHLDYSLHLKTLVDICYES